MFKRIIAYFTSLVILFSLTSVSFAAEKDYVNTPQSYWDRLLHWSINAADKLGLGGIAQFSGFIFGTICEASSDGYHHTDSLDGCKLGTDEHGQYAIATCQYCGKPFNCYSSDLQRSYDAQVQELPAQGFTSEGNLIWSPALSECVDSSFELLSPWEAHFWFAVPADASTFTYAWRSDNNVFYKKIDEHSAKVYGSMYQSTDLWGAGFNKISWLLPFDCAYRQISSPYLDILYQDSSGEFYFGSVSYSERSSYLFGSAGELIGPGNGLVRLDRLLNPDYACNVSYTIYTPQFLLIPDTVPSGDTYNINSRPTSITGDYGIIGDNGQITKVEGNTIVNETNNTVYNPVTNTTSNVTDWQYDYSTRTYNLTLDNGTTSTVTYGDENVTIIEGDTIYNVYYLVNGSDTPGPEVCNHSWTETSSTPATCTVPGSRLLTCSLCNETKTETIPAPGHTWAVRQTVNTEYDDTGQLTQQGYTIFECSVCHEQYKSEDGTAPPGGGSGTDPGGDGESLWDKLGDLIGSGLGGLLGLVEAALGKLLDALIALVDMITGKFKEVVEGLLSIFDQVPALFGGFLGLLSAVFPFLPPEIMALLTLGIAAVVFIGIIKAIRR